MTTVIPCTARLARALGHSGPFRRGWADHHHILVKVPSALADTLVEREVYEWRTETTSIVYDASDERCAELYAANLARERGVDSATHVMDLDSDTSQCVGHTVTRFGDYIVTEVVDERADEVVAIAWGSACEAHEAGC